MSIRMTKVSRINDDLGVHETDIDLLICSASFESRCRTIPEHLSRSHVRNVLICTIPATHQNVDVNAGFIEEIYQERAALVELDSSNAVVTADSIRKSLEKFSDTVSRVVIDITAFRHETLLLLIQLCEICFDENVSVICMYTAAKEYAVDLVGSDKWLSRGIGEIRSVLGFPGERNPIAKSHLIVLVGFEQERAEKLIDCYEPSVISLGFGSVEGSVNDKHQEINKEFHQRLVNKYANVEEFEFSCIDPDMAISELRNQIEKYPTHNVIVAPMNTKLSSVAVSLLGMENKKVQVCYAEARTYNFEHYSTPSDDCYIYELPKIKLGF